MTALMSWLDDMDALVGTERTAASVDRLDTLIDQGVTLLADEAPRDGSTIDPGVIDRIQHRLRAIADEVAAELDAVRRERRQLTRAGRAHAGYQAGATP